MHVAVATEETTLQAQTSRTPGGGISAIAFSDRLGRGRVAGLMGLGVVLWLVVALLIRYGAPLGLFEGVASVLLFVFTVPVVWLLVWATRHALSLRPGQIVAGVAIACATAQLCDGVALGWAPFLYGADSSRLLPAAAWLLWSYGVSLTLAFVASRPTSL